MSTVVLSIGSNLGDRLALLQSVVDGLGDAVVSVSPVYETDAWGGVEQGPFLNAVVVADDDALDCHGWLRRGQELENVGGRVRDALGPTHTRRRPDHLPCRRDRGAVRRRGPDTAASARASARLRPRPVARGGRRRHADGRRPARDPRRPDGRDGPAPNATVCVAPTWHW